MKKSTFVKTGLIVILVIGLVLVSYFISKRYHGIHSSVFQTVIMEPAIPIGAQLDWIDIDKIDRGIRRWDLVVVRYSKEILTVMRVWAIDGDTVIVGENEVSISWDAGWGSAKIKKTNSPCDLQGESRRMIGRNEYFLMGDNLRVANDSRYLGIYGRDKIVGVVVW